jgi:hypothetical protein
MAAVAESVFEMVFQEMPVFVYGGAPSCSNCTRVDEPVMAGVSIGQPPAFDVSKTSDGAIVVSNAFRASCADVAGVRFVAVDDVPGYFTLELDGASRLDPFESHVAWGPMCEACGRPRYVTRSGPLRLGADTPPLIGFGHTDIEFGDSADFGPTHPIRFRSHVLVGRPTARLLKSAALSGVHLIAQP